MGDLTLKDVFAIADAAVGAIERGPVQPQPTAQPSPPVGIDRPSGAEFTPSGKLSKVEMVLCQSCLDEIKRAGSPARTAMPTVLDTYCDDESCAIYNGEVKVVGTIVEAVGVGVLYVPGTG